MNKYVILSTLILIGMASCELTNIERHCKEFKIVDNFKLHANCKVDDEYKLLKLDLNTCLGIKDGILLYPGNNLYNYCDKCYLQESFNLYCNCWKTSSLRSRSDDDANMSMTEDRNRDNLILSYMNFRSFIRFEDNLLSC